MKAAIEMKAEARATAGKGAARAARRNGQVPVIVYGNGKGNVSLNVEARALANEYFRGGFMNKIVSLKLDGKDMFAIPRDIQLNPVSDKIEHADFLAVDEKSIVKVWVPIHFTNTEKSAGIKRGGVLNIVAHRVELLAPVNNIPSSIDVDVATLDIGSSVHIGNLELPKGVKAASKRTDITIASINGRQKDEEADVAATGAPVAGAVPSTKSAAAGAAAAAAPAAGGKAAPAAKPAAKK
ncbi:MAG: 50S ribosomal protein L25/general stress protein Ctc [Pseudomonadota bacterium]